MLMKPLLQGANKLPGLTQSNSQRLALRFSSDEVHIASQLKDQNR
jgi:hypothetical protein